MMAQNFSPSSLDGLGGQIAQMWGRASAGLCTVLQQREIAGCDEAQRTLLALSRQLADLSAKTGPFLHRGLFPATAQGEAPSPAQPKSADPTIDDLDAIMHACIDLADFCASQELDRLRRGCCARIWREATQCADTLGGIAMAIAQARRQQTVEPWPLERLMAMGCQWMQDALAALARVVRIEQMAWQERSCGWPRPNEAAESPPVAWR